MEELNKIEKEFEKFLDSFKNTSDYLRYIELKERMNNNKKINTIISEIKNIQKDIVKREYNKEPIEELEKDIDDKLNLLNQIPLYVEYNKYLEIVNDQINLIVEKLNNYVSEL